MPSLTTLRGPWHPGMPQDVSALIVIEWETSLARDVILMAAEHGWRPPLPKWFSFTEWRNRARPEVQHPDRER